MFQFKGDSAMARRRQFRTIIEKYFSNFRKSQRTTLYEIAKGLLISKAVGLASIARCMRNTAFVRHRIKRIERFITNPRICSEKATRALVQWLLCPKHLTVVSLDWTHFRQYSMLVAKVLVCRRGIPVAWAVMRRGEFNEKRKSRNHVEEQLIELLRDVLRGYEWVLLADRGFARASLIKKLQQWGIKFVLRAMGDTWVETDKYAGLLDSLPRRVGKIQRYEEVVYQKSARVKVGLVLSHAEPAAEPWYLLTNLKGTRQVERLYRKRMWIEESFRDAKSGLGLKRLRLSEPVRYERMMIVVAVVMALMILSALVYRRRWTEDDLKLATKRRGQVLSVFTLGMRLVAERGLPPKLWKVKLHALAKGV